jgi:hypothetical protein
MIGELVGLQAQLSTGESIIQRKVVLAYVFTSHFFPLFHVTMYYAGV